MRKSPKTKAVSKGDRASVGETISNCSCRSIGGGIREAIATGISRRGINDRHHLIGWVEDFCSSRLHRRPISIPTRLTGEIYCVDAHSRWDIPNGSGDAAVGWAVAAGRIEGYGGAGEW